MYIKKAPQQEEYNWLSEIDNYENNKNTNRRHNPLNRPRNDTRSKRLRLDKRGTTTNQ